MHACTECGTQYVTRLSAIECAEMDRAEDARQHQWFKAHPRGAHREA